MDDPFAKARAEGQENGEQFRELLKEIDGHRRFGNDTVGDILSNKLKLPSEQIEGKSWITTYQGASVVVHDTAEGLEWENPDDNMVVSARKIAKNAIVTDIDSMSVTKRKLLIGTILARGKLTVAGASGGLGKSTFCMALALTAASGVKKFGLTCHEGPLKVAVFSTEDELEEVKRLAKATAVLNGVRSQHIEDRLSIYGSDVLPEWFSFVITEQETGRGIIHEKAIGWIEAVISANKSDLVILDPLFGLTGGHELSQELMNLLARRVKKIAIDLNISILLIHHTRKGSGSGAVGADELTGGKTLVNAARAVLTFRKLTNDEINRYFSQNDRAAANDVRVVDNVKTNIGPDGGSIFYQMGVVVLRDDDDGCDFDMQAAKPWSPPQMTHGLHASLWREIVKAIDAEPFILFAENATSRTAPKLRDIIQKVCDAEFDANGDVRHDAGSFERQIRGQDLIERDMKVNPNTQGRDKVAAVKVSEAGRRFAE